MFLFSKIKNNLKNIFGEFLSWNIKDLENKKKFYKTKKIPAQINSILDFQKISEPLFFEEFRAQINRLTFAQLKTIKQNECKIVWIGIKRKKATFLVRFSKKFKQKNKKGDFLILSIKSKTINSKTHDLGFCFISNISQNENEYIIETSYEILEFVTKKPSTNIFLRQIFISPSFFKEFFSLKLIRKIPDKIGKILFNPKNNFIENYYFDFHVTNRIHLKSHFNKSQINSMFSVFDSKITLIQGPPGTGKTRTILGIISLVIHFNQLKKKKKYLKLFHGKEFYKAKKIFKKKISLDIKTFFLENILGNLNPKYEFFFKFFKNSKSKSCFNLKNKRIIVCAFSNAATDENTIRITLGLPIYEFFKPNHTFSILRLGPNYKIFLDHITLDNYALIWASENDPDKTLWNKSKILQKSRTIVLKNSFIIYTTLACASYSFFEKIKKKEMIIIDEAAQAIELSTLSPIRNTCKKLILVGDIQQLPATVFSQTSLNFDYDRSLFKRLQIKKFPIWFLETQYRMHPQISSFIARKFYKNGLKDSENVSLLKNFQFLRGFGPLIFFDVCEGNDRFHLKQKNSWCNLDEIRLVSFIIRGIICIFSNLSWRSIGIIASYQGQIGEFQDFGIMKQSEFKGQINSVDGFQGREKEIVFFSSVRAKLERGVGFLSDCRRINVAFTRAKSCFWAVGNFSTLQKDQNWAEAILDARKRGRLFDIRKPFERSNRRLVFWGSKDEENYFFDGENFHSLNFFLVNYVKNFFF